SVLSIAASMPGSFPRAGSAGSDARSSEIRSAIEPTSRESQQTLRHEDDDRDEDEADRDQIVLGEEAREALAQQQEERGAENRPDQGADAADHVVDHRLTRDQEVDEVGRR